MDTDNSIVITQGGGVEVEVEEGKGINGDGENVNILKKSSE